MKERYIHDNDYRTANIIRKIIDRSKPEGIKRKHKEDELYKAKKKCEKNSRQNLITEYLEKRSEGPDKVCCCCAQLFFKNSIIDEHNLSLKFRLKHKEVCRYRPSNTSYNGLCTTCKSHLDQNNIPPFAAINGLIFEPLPDVLSDLNSLEQRFVSAIQVFMQIRELGYQKQYGLKGHCINVPCDVNKMITKLPRMNTDDDTVLVQLMRRMSDKQPYAYENVRPEKIFKAALYLTNTDVYKQHNITLNENWLQEYNDYTNKLITNNDNINSNTDSVADDTESESSCDEQDALEHQDTLITSGYIGSNGLKIAPSEGQTPVSILMDDDLDILAFPCVYAGKQRKFEVKYNAVQIAKAEARMHDRRVATNIPKLMFNFCRARIHKLRSRISIALRQTKNTEGLTVSKCLDENFISSLTDKNDAFKILAVDRASPAYWQKKQKTALAMLRQYGPATFFMTFSSADTKWIPLLITLSKTIHNKIISEEEAENLTWQEKIDLIKKDPITCARYFDHRFNSFWKVIVAKNGTFYPYRVKHFIRRHEMQFRGKDVFFSMFSRYFNNRNELTHLKFH